MNDTETKINPWEVEGSPWDTEAKFITWIRGVLRNGWSVHPIKLIYLTSRKKKIKNTNPRSMKAHPEVWAVECEQCHKEVKPSAIEVDHAGDIQGTFTCMDEIQGYAEHLYLVDFDSLQTVCKPCHKIRTHSQKSGLSFEDATIEKEVIYICKQPTEKVLAFCQDYEYDVGMLTNAAKRKSAVTAILKGVL